MAISSTISQRELERVAGLCYEGKTINVMLCNVSTTGYNSESTVAQWQAQEITTTGYSRFSVALGSGSYNSTTNRYEVPSVLATFSATTATLTYDTVIIYVTGETYIHSLITENPNIVLSPGQTQSYSITLATDD
jgi:hypothetical protein